MGDFLQPYSASVRAEKTNDWVDPDWEFTEEKLCAWDDGSSRKMVGETNHKLWGKKGRK